MPLSQRNIPLAVKAAPGTSSCPSVRDRARCRRSKPGKPSHRAYGGIVNRSQYNPAWIDRWNGFLRDTAADNRGKVSVVDLNKVLDPAGHWTDTVDGVTVRITDRMHLTVAGADLAANTVVPQILGALPAPPPPPP